MTNIQIFHEYNRIVRRGGLIALRHSCGNAYALRADKDGEPLLQCYWCNVRVTPGGKMVREITGQIEQYNKERNEQNPEG